MPNDRKKPDVKKKVPNAPRATKADAGLETEYPRHHTEQEREKKPGTFTREEIRTKLPRGKTH